MSLSFRNGKYYCDTHNLECEWCQNHITGHYFVKCPSNKYFECGTATITESEVHNYNMYAPNYENNMCDYISDLIEKDED